MLKVDDDGNYIGVYTLQFSDSWLGSVNSVWENSANWSCGTVPDMNTDVIVNSGTVVLSSNTTIKSLKVNPNASLTVAPGINLTISH